MDDNTFDCPNCGARIYPEMTRCPQCGQNMYPEDEPEFAPEDQFEQVNWVTILGYLLLGWLVAAGVALLLHFIIASLVTPSALGGIARVILFLAGPLGSLVGGYVSAGTAKRYTILLGGLVGVFLLPVLVLLTTHWVQVTLTLLFNPWILLTGFSTILAGVAGGWINSNFIQNQAWQEKWKVRGWEDILYRELLRRVRFNGSIADRLIDYERRQQPQASRLQLIQNAIERWEKDNR